ncbi:KBTBD5_10 [Mytilus edulis]|uniref:KBTBD5_10 n=1 Tax=Mytilus edulis TaxID=6550 RepID=A0A8S3R3P9_MYTED|nr:KBTBD5_10 [Mytilus edulis]
MELNSLLTKPSLCVRSEYFRAMVHFEENALKVRFNIKLLVDKNNSNQLPSPYCLKLQCTHLNSCIMDSHHSILLLSTNLLYSLTTVPGPAQYHNQLPTQVVISPTPTNTGNNIDQQQTLVTSTPTTNMGNITIPTTNTGNITTNNNTKVISPTTITGDISLSTTNTGKISPPTTNTGNIITTITSDITINNKHRQYQQQPTHLTLPPTATQVISPPLSITGNIIILQPTQAQSPIKLKDVEPGVFAVVLHYVYTQNYDYSVHTCSTMSEMRQHSENVWLPLIMRKGKNVSVNFDADHYTEFIKYLYCPKLYDVSNSQNKEVRQMSIKMPTLRSKGVQRNAQLWMPPKSVVQTLAKNVDCPKVLPISRSSFCSNARVSVEGCLLKLQSGEIEYNLT